MTAHNLAPGFYLLDHTTGEVLAGPFTTRNQLLSSDQRQDHAPTGPLAVLEVVGDVIPWLGGAVGNVCVDAATAAASYEDRIDQGDHATEDEWNADV